MARGLVSTASAMVCLVAATAGAQKTQDSVKRAGAASKPLVVHIENSVRPESFSGKCPATLHWTAKLTVRNPPLKVRYQWLRSDSAQSPVKEILVRGTEGIVGGESWQLGGAKDRLIVWERLRVLSPNAVNSRAAAVKVMCK
jgi:hypothetical protein